MICLLDMFVRLFSCVLRDQAYSIHSMWCRNKISVLHTKQTEWHDFCLFDIRLFFFVFFPLTRSWKIRSSMTEWTCSMPVTKRWIFLLNPDRTSFSCASNERSVLYCFSTGQRGEAWQFQFVCRYCPGTVRAKLGDRAGDLLLVKCNQHRFMTNLSSLVVQKSLLL